MPKHSRIHAFNWSITWAVTLQEAHFHYRCIVFILMLWKRFCYSNSSIVSGDLFLESAVIRSMTLITVWYLIQVFYWTKHLFESKLQQKGNLNRLEGNMHYDTDTNMIWHTSHWLTGQLTEHTWHRFSVHEYDIVSCNSTLKVPQGVSSGLHFWLCLSLMLKCENTWFRWTHAAGKQCKPPHTCMHWHFIRYVSMSQYERNLHLCSLTCKLNKNTFLQMNTQKGIEHIKQTKWTHAFPKHWIILSCYERHFDV